MQHKRHIPCFIFVAMYGECNSTGHKTPDLGHIIASFNAHYTSEVTAEDDPACREMVALITGNSKVNILLLPVYCLGI